MNTAVLRRHSSTVLFFASLFVLGLFFIPTFIFALTCTPKPVTCPAGEARFYTVQSADCPDGGYYCQGSATSVQAPKPSTTAPKLAPATTTPNSAPAQSTPVSTPKSITPTKPTTYATGMRTLAFGMRGDDVLTLQKQLIARGFLPPESATGYYGKYTREAVQLFQSQEGIVSSGDASSTGYGAVGPKTRAALSGTQAITGQMPSTYPSASQTSTEPSSQPTSQSITTIQSLTNQLRTLQETLAKLSGSNRGLVPVAVTGGGGSSGGPAGGASNTVGSGTNAPSTISPVASGSTGVTSAPVSVARGAIVEPGIDTTPDGTPNEPETPVVAPPVPPPTTSPATTTPAQVAELPSLTVPFSGFFRVGGTFAYGLGSTFCTVGSLADFEALADHPDRTTVFVARGWDGPTYAGRCTNTTLSITTPNMTVPNDSNVVFTWSATNVLPGLCTVSDSNGTTYTGNTGAKVTGVLTASRTYTLTCKKVGGATISETLPITVLAAGAQFTGEFRVGGTFARGLGATFCTLGSLADFQAATGKVSNDVPALSAWPTTMTTVGRCSAMTERACQWDGKTLAHGASVSAYQASSVPAGSSCASETRTCTNGTLSGSYANTSCTVALPASCTFNGVSVADGASVTAYQASSAPAGSTCTQQTRTCSNGTLSGSYTYSACTVAQAAACTFNGQSIPSGASVTAYQSASVSTGSCASQSRTCSNGTLSGSYTNASCTVAAAASKATLTNLSNSSTNYGVWSVGQTTISNQNGIFFTYAPQASGNEFAPGVRYTWHLMRSTDGGKTFASLYSATEYSRPPVIETDAAGNIYLLDPMMSPGDGTRFMRFAAAKGYAKDIDKMLNINISEAKYASYLDAARSVIYFSGTSWDGEPNFFKVSLSGELLAQTQVTREGPRGYLEYPRFTMDPAGTLYLAWTNGVITDPNGTLTPPLGRWVRGFPSIHYVQSKDGGTTWANVGQTTPLALPVISDYTGPVTTIVPSSEFPLIRERENWLSGFAYVNGSLFFSYNSWYTGAPPDYQHFIRINPTTGVKVSDITPTIQTATQTISDQGGAITFDKTTGDIYYGARAVGYKKLAIVKYNAATNSFTDVTSIALPAPLSSGACQNFASPTFARYLTSDKKIIGLVNIAEYSSCTGSPTLLRNRSFFVSIDTQ